MVSLIPLYINKGKAFCWDAEDVLRLRQEQRIVGSLVGCLPRLPKQNLQLGLPLQLLPEETTLLQEKGVVQLLDDSLPAAAPTQEERTDLKDVQEKLYHDQVALCHEEAKKEVERRLPEITAGIKAKKRRELEQAEAAGQTVDLEHFDRTFSVNLDDLPVNKLSRKHSCVQIPTACRRKKLYPAADWRFPETAEDRQRFLVFRDLWQQGYWLTSGGKFGGDFLLYPGDPARFHSFHIALCVPYSDRLSAQDIMTFSRLGTNVKKTVVLCSVNPQERLVYTSLEWAGIT